MEIQTLRRYPVKSMLGEAVDEVELGPGGVANDRGFALVDTSTGLVATAKHPRLWRSLLTCTAGVDGDRTVISSPAGWSMDVADREVDATLSAALGRDVRLVADRPEGATVERPDPEDVLAHGVEAVVPAATLEIAQGTAGATFVDYAAVHLITTATLEAIGAEAIRYRPNIVIRTPEGTPPFVENDWTGRELRIGDGVALRITIPTPRCSVPTLEHGPLPRAPHAVRRLLADNRVEVPGFGVLPCAGVYAEVHRSGTVRVGAAVVLV